MRSVEEVEEGLRELCPYTPYTYVFVRKDLDETYRLIQVGHACLELGRLYHEKLGTHPHFAVMQVENEGELMNTILELRDQGVHLANFYEPDYDTGYTAFATAPMIGEERRKMLKYEMYRRD